MTELALVGIGTGNPEHVTLEALRVLSEADLILIPRKAGKEDLAELRHAILSHLPRIPPVAEFDLPVRDPSIPDYTARVEAWHDAIAEVWRDAMGHATKVALMIWGDPSLYDSSLRIAARLDVAVRVVAGITSVQALCAAHAMPLNTVGGPITITTGRRLRDHGWPEGAETVVVMLDAGTAFTTLTGPYHIAWTAFAGMPEEISVAGPLDEVAPRIQSLRAEARARHGWIMDIYRLRRLPAD